MKQCMCNKIYLWLIREQSLSKREQERLLYRIKCIYNTLYIWTIIMMCSIIINRFLLTLVSVFTLNYIRYVAGGWHANTLNKCAVISTLSLVILPYALSFITLPNLVFMMLFFLAPLGFVLLRIKIKNKANNQPMAFKLFNHVVLRACMISAIGICITSLDVKYYILVGIYSQLISNIPEVYTHDRKDISYEH